MGLFTSAQITAFRAVFFFLILRSGRLAASRRMAQIAVSWFETPRKMRGSSP
jgi:hypothetical protein